MGAVSLPRGLAPNRRVWSRTSAPRAVRTVPSSRPRGGRARSLPSGAPPLATEYAYYLVLFYGMLAPTLGIAVPYLGGLLLLGLAALCAIQLGPRATAVLAPLKLLLLCGASFLAVDLTIHGGSVLSGAPRMFITWILAIVIVRSLCLRPRFLHRCTRFLWVMGLTTLPYLVTGTLDMRVSVDSALAGDFNNPNGLGGWFGFCGIYFTVLAVETRRPWLRVFSSLAALSCLYTVGLSVSRGALLGTSLGMLVALRRVLGRGFVPTLIVTLFVGTVYLSGLFDPIVSRFAARATEESGRLLVWPEALRRFLTSPLLGVGAAQVATYVPATREIFTPHNSFLWFGLAAGVVPLALFIAWWVRAARNALAWHRPLQERAFQLPFLMHTFVVSLAGDLGFMQPWGILTFCIAAAPDARYPRRGPVSHRAAPRPRVAARRQTAGAGAIARSVRS